jgi:hypothetical protein
MLAQMPDTARIQMQKHSTNWGAGTPPGRSQQALKMTGSTYHQVKHVPVALGATVYPVIKGQVV